jgi:hypothetical protein
LADLSPGGVDVTRLSLPDEMFELGEDLFDGIEVGAVGRQEDEVGAFGILRSPQISRGHKSCAPPRLSSETIPRWPSALWRDDGGDA